MMSILGFFDYLNSDCTKDYKNFNIESFELSEKDFMDIPYGDSTIELFWKNKKFDLQWITYKDDMFVKNDE